MRDFCTLDFQGRTFAVAFECLREVIEPPLITPVPMAPAGVCGVANLRGDLLPVLALDPLLGMQTPQGVLARRPWMAVFESGKNTLGILTSGVGTLREVAVETFTGEQPPLNFIAGQLGVADPKPPLVDLGVLLRQLTEKLHSATHSNS